MGRIPVFSHPSGDWRPTWRGRIHAVALLCTIPAGAVLALLTPSGLARIAVAIYVVSLMALYSTSASYHLFTRSYRAQRTMQQLDHAMVYVLIAGTYTPVCLLGLPSPLRWIFLAAIWGMAAVGMGLKVAWRARRTAAALYLVIGWAVIAVLPWAQSRTGWFSLTLYALGGVIYTVGAVLFYLKRPRLRPLVFGYHEVWHVMTVVAAVLQFAALGVLVARVA
jgi:hemolysin III